MQQLIVIEELLRETLSRIRTLETKVTIIQNGTNRVCDKCNEFISRNDRICPDCDSEIPYPCCEWTGPCNAPNCNICEMFTDDLSGEIYIGYQGHRSGIYRPKVRRI